MDWIGMPADATSKAENHLTWQKNLSCDCVDLLHNGFVQIAKLIWFQDYLSCPSCILHWILFFLTEIELVKICLLADFQELECQPPSSKEVETLPTAIVLDWFAGSPNFSKLQHDLEEIPRTTENHIFTTCTLARCTRSISAPKSSVFVYSQSRILQKISKNTRR